MANSSLAGIITACGTVLTAVALIITAYAGLVRSRKVEHKVDEAITQGAEVHKIVNQQHTDTMNYQRALIRALEARGITVPVDQSIPATPSEDLK